MVVRFRLKDRATEVVWLVSELTRSPVLLDEESNKKTLFEKENLIKM